MRCSTLLLCVTLLACDRSSADRGADGGEGEPEVPAAFAGYFHLVEEDAVDLVNLRLAEDETFRWMIEGCDFGAIVTGRWSTTDDGVLLAPAEGQELTWVHDVTYAFPVDEVELTVGDQDLIATARVGGDVVFTQTWAAGGACAACGPPPDLGPTGQCTCDDPFAASTCSAR